MLDLYFLKKIQSLGFKTKLQLLGLGIPNTIIVELIKRDILGEVVDPITNIKRYKLTEKYAEKLNS